MGVDFVPSEPGPAPTLPQVTPGPPIDEVFGAAFRQGNPIVSGYTALHNGGPFEPQEGYNAWDDIKKDPTYLNYALRFAGSRSPAETQSIKSRIDQEEHDKQVMAASGASGFLAATIAGTLDPTLLLPGRLAIGALREGTGLLRGGLEVGGAMAVQSTAQELALQASQKTRTAEESVLNVGSATVLGALLGGAAGVLSPAEHARLTTALDEQRGQMAAHAGLEPPLTQAPPEPVPPGSEPYGLSGTLRLPIGKEDGFLEYHVNPEDLEMRYSYLPDEERGKGIGFAGYKKLVDWALSTGREFVSLTEKSPDAARIYDKLEKLGYKVDRGISGPTERGGVLGEVKITEGPRAPSAPMPAAVGAAAPDTRESRLVGAGGLEKLSTDPLMRTLNSPLVTARRTVSDLVENPLELQQNLPTIMRDEKGQPLLGPDGRPLMRPGETSTEFGGPAVETAVRVAKFTADNAILDEMKQQWADLRFGGRDTAPKFAELRDTIGGWMGRNPSGVTFEQFDRMVAEAMSKNDTHTIPQVQAAAQFVRSKVAQWPDRAEASIEGFQKIEPKEGEGYFPHDWNRQLIRDMRPEFVNFLVGKFAADQRVKKDIQTRLQAYSDQLVSHETRIKQLTERTTRTEASDAELTNSHILAAQTRKRIEEELGKWEGRSTAEAKSALKARAKYEAERIAKAAEAGKAKPTERLTSADDAVDLAVKRILESEQNLDVEALRGRAHETTDHILSTPDGRIYQEGAPYQIGPGPPSDARRGSEQNRTINVSNAEAWPWINQDAQRVWRKYLNTFIPDVSLAERFGDVEMTEPKQKILDEANAKIDTMPPGPQREKLDAAKNAAIRDISAMRDRLRGVYNIPANETARMIGRVSAAVRNLNVPMSMGMSAVSSFGDAAGVMMRWGMASAFRDGFVPYVTSLMTDQKLARAQLGEFRAAGIAIDTQFAARHHALADTTDAYANGSPLERTLQYGADKFQLLNMLGPWTDRIKAISTTVAAVNFYKATEALEKGAASEKQLRALGAANINAALALRIAEQYRTHGTEVGGVLLPNLAEWTDQSAREAFNGALAREANIMVVTPGIDKPLLMSDPMVALLTQFKSYTAAAHTRILLANLQRRDGDALGGLVGALGLGMLSYKLNALTGGQPTSQNPGDWIKEGMSRSNLLGWFEEGNAFASKMTRGQLDAYRLTGSQHMLSKYAGRSALDQILGPTAGKIERLSQVTGSAASMDWKPSDTHALRQLFFMQNLVYFRSLFDQVDTGAHPPGH